MNAHFLPRWGTKLGLVIIVLAALFIRPDSVLLIAGAKAPPPDPEGKLTSIVPPALEGDEIPLRDGRQKLPPFGKYKISPSPVKPRQLLGSVNLLAIMVDFSDNPATVTNLPNIDSMLFAAPVIGRGSVRDYYAAASYNQVDLVTVNMPSSTNWQRPAQTYAYYTAGNWGWGSYPTNAAGMVAAVLPLLDPLVDFSQYDNDGDGWVDTLLVIHAGTGAEFSNNANDIWSHASSLSLMGGSAQTLDGVGVDNYVTVPEYWDPAVVTAAATDMTIGVIAHEVAHGLWGMPDLYDVDGSSYGIGQWGLMSYGDWNGPAKWNPFRGYFITDGSSPALPGAWSRLAMGFDTYMMALNPFSITLPPVETSQGQIVRLKSTALAPQEYFLVENRQRLFNGYDQYLPGSGLLIWHVDEGMASIYGGPDNNSECATTVPHCWGSCAGSHYLVALEQADGLDHLENLSNVGDTGDPFPGASGKTSFLTYSAVTPVNPESNSWYDTTCGTNSCLGITGIALQGGVGPNINLSVSQAACLPSLEADLGDAPDSINSFGAFMTAYQPEGPFPHVLGNFPTVFTLPPPGPRHHFCQIDSWLGASVTGEWRADAPPDQDPQTNINPPADLADMDSVNPTSTGDDGITLPIVLAHCNGVSFPYQLNVLATGPYSVIPRYLNAWFDWKRNGDWMDTIACPGGPSSPEWAVQNQLLSLGIGTHNLSSPSFVPFITIAEGTSFQAWMRLSVAEMPAPAPYDGSGPPVGYDLGETEDYLLSLMPSFSKTSSVSGRPQVGETITYHIQYDGVGNVIAQGIIISDVLPSGVTYVSSNPAGAYNASTRTVTWAGNLSPNNFQTIDLVVQVSGAAGTTVTNTGYLMWADTIWQQATDQFQIACTSADPIADFGWPTPAMVSETITFTNLSTGSIPLTYAWDLDDDGVVDSTAANPSWQYNVTGTVTVTLATTNTYGCSDLHSAPVSVLSPDDFYTVYLPLVIKD